MSNELDIISELGYKTYSLDKIYQEYGYFKEDITNVALAGLAGKAKIERIMDYFRNNDIKLDGFNILAKDDVKLSVHKDLKSGKESEIKLPKSNVIKYYLNDDMWFVLRPSGTEPKLKIYYGVNGKSHAESDAKLANLKKQVLDIFNTINDKNNQLVIDGVKVDINRGRKKIETIFATIKDVYPSVFTIKTEDEKLQTFSYFDVLCGNIVFEENA